MKTEALPIIFYQDGYQEFLEYALAQARHSNPASKMYVICDDSVIKRLIYRRSINIIPINNYAPLIEEFEKHYQHFSANPIKYELVCFVRWIAIYELMRENNINSAFICDSDCLVYSNISELFPLYNAEYASLIIVNDQEPFVWVASGGESYWNIKGLKLFVEYLFDAYKNGIRLLLNDKIKYHQTQNVAGGVCDMTLLYKFYIQNRSKFSNILTVTDGGTFDMAIGTSDNEFRNEYQFDGNKKIINYTEKIPFGYNIILDKQIRFHLLHFQGASKPLMKEFYEQVKILNFQIWCRATLSKSIKTLLYFKNKITHKHSENV